MCNTFQMDPRAMQVYNEHPAMPLLRPVHFKYGSHLSHNRHLFLPWLLLRLLFLMEQGVPRPIYYYLRILHPCQVQLRQNVD